MTPVKRSGRSVRVLRAWRRRGPSLLLELLVVFLGVYGAFLLDRYQEGRRDVRLREQLHATLVRELEDAGCREEVAAWDSLVYRPFMQPYERGEMPIPRPLFPQASSFRGGGSWSALAAAGVGVLEPALLVDIENLLETLAYTNNEVDILRAYVVEHLLPHAGAGVETFYDRSTGRLRDSFRWYVLSLERLRQGFYAGCEASDAVLEKLRQVQRTGAPYASSAAGGP